MKLTQDQIITLKAALRDYEDKATSRAEVYTDSTYWSDNAETARTLQAILEDALSVEVESVHVDAPAAAAAPELIAKHGKADVPETLVALEGRKLRPKAPLAPALLNAIDNCADGQSARDVLRNAEPSERRAVAKFLGIPLNDLHDVITHRKAA